MNIQKVCLVVVLIVSIATAFAGWERTYGGAFRDDAYSIIQATDGGFIVTGKTESLGFGSDGYSVIYLFKINESGDIQWSNTFGDSLKSSRGDVLLNMSDGYVLGGTAFQAGYSYSDFLLMKFTDSGDSVLTNYYGGIANETLKDMIHTSDNAFLMVGQTTSFGAGGNGDAYIVKADTEGTALWEYLFGETGNQDYANSVIETSDGGFIIVITSRPMAPSPGYNDLVLLKLDSHGDSVWTKCYSGLYRDWGESIIKTEDNNYLISGAYGTSLYYEDWWLLKIDEDGDTIWTKTYGGHPHLRGVDIKLLPDGGFIAINSIQTSDAEAYDIHLVRLDSECNIIWDSYFGGDDHDIGGAVIALPDGGFMIAGSVSSFGEGNFDCFVAKLDSLGNSSLQEKKALPEGIRIAAYPSPFNSEITIDIWLPADELVTVEIYNISGSLVKTLFSGGVHGGLNTFVWNGLDDGGLKAPTGSYFAKVATETETKTMNILLLK